MVAIAPSIFSVDFSLSALMLPAGSVGMKILSIIHRLGISSETQQKIAPTEQISESEEMLLHNYKLLNNQGKKRLIEYSHDLTEIPKYASSNSEEKKPRMVPIRSVARNGLILENEIPEDVANEISEKLKTPHSDFKW